MQVKENTPKGIILILIGMSAVTLQDILIKLLTSEINIFLLLLCRSSLGLIFLLIFLKILSEKNIKSSELVENYHFMPSSGEINYIVEDVEISLKKIENSFEGEFDKLDGLSYFSDDFWFNLRGSNTEPMLRLNAEAINQKTLDNIIEKISNIIS